MVKRIFLFLLPFFLFVGCAFNQQPIDTKSITVIFKTPNLKFYDKGFVEKYENRIHLSIFSSGVLALDLNIYEDKICQGLFRCIDGKEFNKQFLDVEYEKDFFYKLFGDENTNFKDEKNGILIKILKDEQIKADYKN